MIGKNRAIDLKKFIVGPLDTNCYLVWEKSTRKGILIDPGMYDSGIAGFIKDKGIKVEYILNTHAFHGLPNLASVSIKYIEGESVMLMLDDDGIAISTRSACATGSLRASHVLLSLGLSHADAQGTLVISFGIDNTEDDILSFLRSLQSVVTTLREISPLYSKKNASHR